MMRMSQALLARLRHNVIKRHRLMQIKAARAP
jgi:hypothetical protein